ncbi:MAG: 4Fe-4S binding protein [Armatimonadetes bacterium]|nr:4Fe-4S binding protein [Armatimonadota bacterium]
MNWEQDALDAVGKAPALLRGMVRKRVEAYVTSLGRDRVTLADVEEARRRARPPARASSPHNGSSGSGSSDEYGGLAPEEIEKIVAETKTAVVSESRFYEVKVCGGAFGCPRTLYDVGAMAKKIVERIEASGLPDVVASRVKGPILRHHKFSVAISGCPNSCSQPQIHDFGLQGRARVGVTESPCIECMACVQVCREGSVTVEDAQVEIDRSLCINCGDCAVVCPTETLVQEEIGYSVLMGGKLGRHPQLAREIIEFADEETVLRSLDVAIDIFCRRRQGEERVADSVTRIGVEQIRSEISRVASY